MTWFLESIPNSNTQGYPSVIQTGVLTVPVECAQIKLTGHVRNPAGTADMYGDIGVYPETGYLGSYDLGRGYATAGEIFQGWTASEKDFELTIDAGSGGSGAATWAVGEQIVIAFRVASAGRVIQFSSLKVECVV